MFERKLLNINDLVLDVDNSRFGDSVDSQREALRLMLENQGPKLIKLAKDIAEHGIDPSESLIVIQSEENDTTYITKEGNRRLTALKLIENPSLANTSTVKDSFEEIKKARKYITTDVNCVVYSSDEYSHWINLKHTGQNEGAGRVGWTTPEQMRYMARNGKESFANQLYSFVDLFPDYFREIIENKKAIRITNLDRLVNDPAFRACLNLTGVGGLLYCSQPVKRFLEQYKKVLDLMIVSDDKGRPEFTVNRIRSKIDRANFISELQLTSFSPELEPSWRLLEPPAFSIEPDNIDPSVKPASEDDPTGGASGGNGGDGGNSGGNGDNGGGKPGQPVNPSQGGDFNVSPPQNVKRSHIVPANTKFKFDKNHKRCHRLFNELKKMSHDDFTNTISVMLRVFVELSLNTYMDENKLVYLDPKNPKRTPGLHDKVVLVSEDLFSKKKLSGQKKSALLSASKQLTNAGASLQQYVHNPHLIPTREFVNTEWDNFEPLLQSIWS